MSTVAHERVWMADEDVDALPVVVAVVVEVGPVEVVGGVGGVGGVGQVDGGLADVGGVGAVVEGECEVPPPVLTAADRRALVVGHLERHGATTFAGLRGVTGLSSTDLNNALRRLSDWDVVFAPTKGTYARTQGTPYVERPIVVARPGRRRASGGGGVVVVEEPSVCRDGDHLMKLRAATEEKARCVASEWFGGLASETQRVLSVHDVDALIGLMVETALGGMGGVGGGR